MNNHDQEFLVQKIRTQYTEKTHTELDALKELDAKVKRPANVFGYVFGGVGAIVMGAGMSLVMTDIGATIGLSDAMIPGIAVGVVGMAMALLTYPIYKRILNSRKKKYAPEILKLSEHGVTDVPPVDPVVAYKAIEGGVVGAYKAVEKGAVDAYRKVEDTMVDKLFRKEDETVEEAKARLRKQ